MSNYGRKASAKVEEIDEVEELLRATEDDMLLKLSVGSHHISRTSSSSLDQDLIRRFEALKTPSVSKTITNVPPMEGSSRSQLKEKKKDGDGGDMFARFSTLKNNGSCSGSSDSMMESSSEMSKIRLDGGDGSTSSNHEDEVSKVIQWAIDAARLDPSLSDDDESNDDDDNDDDDSESESESDDVEDEEENDNVKRKPCKSGSGSKKKKTL